MAERRRAVFLDRDGTLLVDRGYTHRPSDMRFLRHVKGGLKALQAGGFDLVLITNQSGVDRGFFTSAQMEEFHRTLAARLAKSEVSLRGVYVCPHHPDAGCPCRKPGTALFEQAVRDLGLDPSASFAVGDRAHDAIAGRKVGCRTVLLRKSYLKRELGELERAGIDPDFIAADFLDAARWILRAR